MIRSVSAETAAENKFLITGPGPKAWIHSYINEGSKHADGSPRKPGDMSPMIYLVDQEPNSAITMHFHQVDQYQIVVGGSGSMGRHPLGPITVHYTNAYTGYGPLMAGPAGLQYLTIRSRWDPGLRPLPESKSELPPAGSYKMRQRTTVPNPVKLDTDLEMLSAPDLRQLMHEGDAHAWMLDLPARQTYDDPSDHRMDRVFIICSGSITGTAANGLMSCHFIPAEERLTLSSGDKGAEILILQFPTSQHHERRS